MQPWVEKFNASLSFYICLFVFAMTIFWAIFRLCTSLMRFFAGREMPDKRHYNGIEPFETLASLIDLFAPLSG
ncbi:TPA: hypothetical protein DDW35_10095, partial [Candidatus Sumerlaeota bacterium]|nr:hypothetical protein [Candidatus Sumerlaeota bacterium]